MNPEPVTQPAPAMQPPQNQNVAVSGESSNKKPVVIIFIIILLLLIGAFYYFMIRKEDSSSNIKPVNQVTQPVITASPSPTPTLNLDSSDTQLDKDIQAINNKANNLAIDVNNVDKGLNDTPLDNGQ